MKDLVSNGAPDMLEISYTTRFNAFLDQSDPFNYVNKGTPLPNRCVPCLIE